MAESNIFNLTFKKLYVDLGGWHKHHRHLSACNTGDVGSVPVLGRSSEGGNGNPLQYSCQENPMERGAWQVIVHRVTKTHTTEATEHMAMHSVQTKSKEKSRYYTPFLQTTWRFKYNFPLHFSSVTFSENVWLNIIFCFISYNFTVSQDLLEELSLSVKVWVRQRKWW